MDILQSIIIAIVEGLTEFLPVSSTGHMIIAEKLLNIPPNDFVKAFTVIIQFGAILSVVCLYWRRFFHLNTTPDGVTGTKALLIRYDFYWKLAIAFVPAAFFGFLLSDYIDFLLENVMTVAIMLVLGGILMLYADRWFNKPKAHDTMSESNAFKIGLYQCIAMIPGVSRSMATIVGAMQQGLSRKAAAEFSFFLAVPTMFAATAYKLIKLILDPVQCSILTDNLLVLLIGNIVAFIVAALAIKFFIGFVTRYGFKAFGWYRIIVGSTILLLMACGVDLALI